MLVTILPVAGHFMVTGPFVAGMSATGLQFVAQLICSNLLLTGMPVTGQSITGLNVWCRTTLCFSGRYVAGLLFVAESIVSRLLRHDFRRIWPSCCLPAVRPPCRKN